MGDQPGTSNSVRSSTTSCSAPANRCSTPTRNASTPQNPTMDMDSLSPASSVPQTNLRSCITCRRRKVRCNRENPCRNCLRFRIPCAFPSPQRPLRRPRLNNLPQAMKEREVRMLKDIGRLENAVDEAPSRVAVESLISNSNIQSRCSPRDFTTRSEVSEQSARFATSKPTSVVSDNDLRMANGQLSERQQWLSRGWYLGDGLPKPLYEIEKEFGTLSVDGNGESRYIGNSFFTRLSEQIPEMEDILAEGSYEDISVNSDYSYDPMQWSFPPMPDHPDHHDFILGYSFSEVDLENFHPSPSQIPFYWQVFVENVDPLVKIFHIPSMNKVVREIQNNLRSLSKTKEALLFAICFASVTSMTPDEVRLSLHAEKSTLIAQFRYGTERALARASFMTSSEMMILQALVLFLSCVRRHDDARFSWTLIALIVRIAQAIGVHRDAKKYNLSPYETEMRRRLWFYISMLELRAAMDQGTAYLIAEGFSDVEIPLNINDSDLDPQMTELPSPKTGITEMTYMLTKYEIGILLRKLRLSPQLEGLGSVPEPSLEEKELMAAECARNMEEKYLKYCSDDEPLQWLIATSARLFFAKIPLIIYHPVLFSDLTYPLSQDIKDRLFLASIQTLEYSYMLERESTSQCWGWLFHTYIQWHAIAFILRELPRRPNKTETTQRACDSLDLGFNYWDEISRDGKYALLWAPLKKLIITTRTKRHASMPLSLQEDSIMHENLTHKDGVNGTVTGETVTSAKDTGLASNTLIFVESSLPEEPQSLVSIRQPPPEKYAQDCSVQQQQAKQQPIVPLTTPLSTADSIASTGSPTAQILFFDGHYTPPWLWNTSHDMPLASPDSSLGVPPPP
ncbi:fungal-specific transcription factor domain-containing protein [Bisporella sp. PMI_857]|nr:fungal-specific transcription factor domain-containing protein [Bisporella sp. PMI_857]